MKYLFVTYCFGNSQGQALIGVYKRGLRIALELCERGHSIDFFCTGRENYHDQLTALAEARMHFVDFPFDDPAFDVAEQNRRIFLESIGRLDPDVVVIGEAPLAGSLLETTLCAVELGIPVVVLDNAYQPEWVEHFCQVHGPMLDGIILTGVSSFHLPKPPPFLHQVPPYIQVSAAEAQSLLKDELGFSGERLVVVLAYDRNVERLGAALIEKLDSTALEVLFITPESEACRERLATRARLRRVKYNVLKPPREPSLFGLLQLARLAIVKCAFMQVTECLSLRTPLIAYYYPGDFTLDYIPPVCRLFAHATTNTEADDETLYAATKFLALPSDAMNAVHNGQFDAISKAADFIEALPLVPRAETMDDCARLAFTPTRVAAALQAQVGCAELQVRQLRGSRLRVLPQQEIFALTCGYARDGASGFARLWGRRFQSAQALADEAARARATNSGRRLLYESSDECILIEKDVGEAMLPSLESQA